MPLVKGRRETTVDHQKGRFRAETFCYKRAFFALLKRASRATISLFANRWHASASQSLRVQALADSLFQVISSLRR
ncbi:hypothetical protein [Burkholderia metallica]|uniref:hypothetical protein n=1 Tax=Burkholderia metallica TaxID=488729 RepID=UPI0015765700|nr:hypothetical protein [Burkholderia metallica]NTZ10844.1 hypothetical protein [Burkholderia metallica]